MTGDGWTPLDHDQRQQQRADLDRQREAHARNVAAFKSWIPFWEAQLAETESVLEAARDRVARCRRAREEAGAALARACHTLQRGRAPFSPEGVPILASGHPAVAREKLVYDGAMEDEARATKRWNELEAERGRLLESIARARSVS